MVHVQAAHMLNIYELGSPDQPSANAPSSTPDQLQVQVQQVQVQVQL